MDTVLFLQFLMYSLFTLFIQLFSAEFSLNQVQFNHYDILIKNQCSFYQKYFF